MQMVEISIEENEQKTQRKTEKVDQKTGERSGFLKTMKNSLFSLLLLISMGVITAVCLVIILTNFQVGLQAEYFVMILGAANTIFVFTLVDMLKTGASIIEKPSRKITGHPLDLVPGPTELPGDNWEISDEEELPPK